MKLRQSIALMDVPDPLNKFYDNLLFRVCLINNEKGERK